MAQEPTTTPSSAPESIHTQSASLARPTPQIETAGPGPIEEQTEATIAVRPSPAFDMPEEALDETPQPVPGDTAPIYREPKAAQRMTVSSDIEQTARMATVDAAHTEPLPMNSAAQWDRMLSDAEAFAVETTEQSSKPETAPLAPANLPARTEASPMVTALDGVLTPANEQTTAPETKRTQSAVRGERERDEKPAAPAGKPEPAGVTAPAAARAQQVEAPARAEIVRMAPGVEMTQRIEALHTAQAAARPTVQSFTVPIGQESNPVATLRLVQMNGGVRMTVQTSDAALGESMQAHLPQLVRGLEDSGFRTNFQPRTESTATMVPASTAVAESRSMEFSDGGGSQHESPAHGQSRERRQPSQEWREWLQQGRRQNKEGH